MKKKQNKKMLILAARKFLYIALLFCSIVLGGFYVDVAAAVETTFLYTLSNFNGPIWSNWANISVDVERNEIYVVDPQKKDVRIFDKNGMEVHRFGDDGSLGTVVDVTVKKDGSILVLSKRHLKPIIILCNFRGEPLSELQLNNLPSDFSNFSPNQLAYLNERIYLLDSIAMRIAVTDTNGLFEIGYDLAAIMEIEEKNRGLTIIDGFSVDREGNMLFTVPVLFSAYTLSPDGKIKHFGRSGSAPGGFGIVGDIVVDDNGYYYVADRLRSVVLIFDKNFKFQSEFGYRGLRPESLIGPKHLALDKQNRLYVSQLRNKGISVFKITYP
jgi:hypothetical protein